MKQTSSHAATAKAIRTELKKLYPSVKFSVTSSSFSMGNSVHINWVNGPTSKEVNSKMRKYEYGHFDGMTDTYEYSNSRDDIPQVKYVQTRRDISEEILQHFFDEEKKHHNGWENIKDLNDSNMEFFNNFRFCTPREYIYFNYIDKQDLTNWRAE